MVIELGESLDISQVQQIKADWEAKKTDNPSCVIDASQLGRVDGAGLQLLLGLVLSCDDIQWQNVPDCLHMSAQHAGMTTLLKLNT
ncbi:STAS domain-containing protein [Salinivibrio kushneri]|uniref:STAS domain-containing protein n=1 Tax=Salinivibrio kushneri TaxID=1908198 RepID=A0AA47KLK9_9GAMM|nr:STAS domain-containing protein [Salinivibrio kushneri]WBA09067.1 STAS domain-containing protein [Salinivibrio kushneri]